MTDAAVRARVRQDVLFGRTVYEAVRNLVAQHPGAERVLCPAPAIERAVAETDLGDESVLLQVADGVNGPPKRCRLTALMDLVEVDPRNTQPSPARGGAPPHGPGDRARREELGCNECRVRVRGQCLAEDALAAPVAAEPRRVDDSNAAHERRDRTAIGLRFRRSPRYRRASRRVRELVERLHGRPLPRTRSP